MVCKNSLQLSLDYPVLFHSLHDMQTINICSNQGIFSVHNIYWGHDSVSDNGEFWIKVRLMEVLFYNYR